MIFFTFASVNLVFSLNASGDYLEPNTREQMPLGAKSAEDP
jgi:hypothetical protein